MLGFPSVRVYLQRPIEGKSKEGRRDDGNEADTRRKATHNSVR